MKQMNILDIAMKIARYACEKAQNDFKVDAGFRALQASEIEGRKCLIVSIVIADPRSDPCQRFSPSQARSQTGALVSGGLSSLQKKQPEGTTDEHRQ